MIKISFAKDLVSGTAMGLWFADAQFIPLSFSGYEQASHSKEAAIQNLSTRYLLVLLQKGSSYIKAKNFTKMIRFQSVVIKDSCRI